MASTRDTLAQIDGQLAESMGVRSGRGPVRLSPAPRPQDIGRRPTAGFGRIDIDMVVPDAQQPRTEFSPEAIDRLAASIREQGQLTPIRVRWSDKIGKWLIIAGERRWRATKHAGLPTIERELALVVPDCECWPPVVRSHQEKTLCGVAVHRERPC